REILLALHLVGMAIIVGGYFTVIRSPKALPGMLHASYLQLITGLLLVVIAEMGEGDVNHVKIGIKLVVAIVVTVFAFIVKMKQTADTAAPAAEVTAATELTSPSPTMAHLTFAYTIINLIVAVFVH